MKISKNIFIRLSALAFALVLSSCSDKLDSQEGQLNTGDIDYTDASQMVEPLIGAYSEISSLGWEEPLLLGVRGDDVNAGGLGDQPLYAETDLFNYNKDFWMYNQVWNSHYNDVINMNTAILQIENFMEFANEADFERGQQYVAEIQVIRAWLHLNLARTWEDIFIITSNQPEAELEQGVATKEEVMQFISDQMDEAIPHLPDMRPNQRPDLTGGITRYTAYALKAMAQQELQNYQGVADATGAIISSGLFSLYPDFYQLFKKPGELSNESLW